MGRKRLVAMLAGAVLVVPVPGLALEAPTDEPELVVIDQVTDTDPADASDSDGQSSDSGTTVPLPGLGEVSVDGELDPADGSGELTASAELEQSDVGLSTEPEVSASASLDGDLDVDASAPTTAGPVSTDPVEELDPVLEPLDDAAPAFVPDVRPEAEHDRRTKQDQVRSAGLPSGGHQARDGAVPSRSVIAISAPRPRGAYAATTRPTSAFAAPAEAAPVVAPGELEPAVAAPDAPRGSEPVGIPALLKLLTAMLVVATGVTNRWIARELG